MLSLSPHLAPTSPPQDVTAFISDAVLSVSWVDPVVGVPDTGIIDYIVEVFGSQSVEMDACGTNSMITTSTTQQRSASIQVQNVATTRYAVHVAAASVQGVGPFSECISAVYSPQADKAKIGVIAGATCGAILGAAIIIYVIVALMRTRKRSKKYRGSRRVAASMMNDHFDLQSKFLFPIICH